VCSFRAGAKSRLLTRVELWTRNPPVDKGRLLGRKPSNMSEKHRPFSERNGFVEPRKVFQLDGMDQPLRNRLHTCFVEKARRISDNGVTLSEFGRTIGDGFFNAPIANLSPNTLTDGISKLFFGGEWYRVYDFLEFVRNRTTWTGSGPLHFEARCNVVMEEQFSGYRFVSGLIAPIDSQAAIEAIEKALKSQVPESRRHLELALGLLSARPEPNSAKAIHEAISAVEAQARDITGQPNATLGEAINSLKQAKKHAPIILALLERLWGWSSGADGVRHAAGATGQTPDRALAKFALVLCSASVNYFEEARSAS
jgi:hypothetical protein